MTSYIYISNSFQWELTTLQYHFAYAALNQKQFNEVFAGPLFFSFFFFLAEEGLSITEMLVGILLGD